MALPSRRSNSFGVSGWSPRATCQSNEKIWSALRNDGDAAAVALICIDSRGRSSRSSDLGSSARMPSSRIAGSASNRKAGKSDKSIDKGSRAPART